jgi:hypothetical protein
MNSDIKQRWIDALRSGKYAQDRGQLRTPHGYCCLGVLCDLYDPYGWTTSNGYAYDEEQFTLPKIVADWAGLMNDPYVTSSNSPYANFADEDWPERIYLAALNDNAHMSFAEIANVIEKEF